MNREENLNINPGWEFSQSWLPTKPRPIDPIPAIEVTDLRGKRVIIGDSTTGWRKDLRADNTVDQSGKKFVPVLTELDYYRAELNGTRVLAPLIPIDKVWVETPRDPSPSPPTNSEGPQRQDPVPIRDHLRVTGQRIVLVTPNGEKRDLRAISEPYIHDDGELKIKICHEVNWYRWALTRKQPRFTSVPIFLSWIE